MKSMDTGQSHEILRDALQQVLREKIPLHSRDSTLFAAVQERARQGGGGLAHHGSGGNRFKKKSEPRLGAAQVWLGIRQSFSWRENHVPVYISLHAIALSMDIPTCKNGQCREADCRNYENALTKRLTGVFP
jgi:hypothetical protein